MNQQTNRTRKIQSYPKLIRCKHCDIEKQRRYYKFNKSGQIKAYCCVSCYGTKSLRPSHYYNSDKVITSLPVFDNTQSAINQIENINHNPKFFSWLCAGTNQNFIP